MAHEGFHEAVESLHPLTLDRHRAIVSIMEELEAVDWYDQRVDATDDPDAGRRPRPQPRRGEGARGDDAGVAAPPRRRCSTSTCARTCSPPARSSRPRTRPSTAATAAARPASRATAASASAACAHADSLTTTSEDPSMNHLLRELAPISDAAWAEIDEEATPHAHPLPRRPQAGRLRRARSATPRRR